MISTVEHSNLYVSSLNVSYVSKILMKLMFYCVCNIFQNSNREVIQILKFMELLLRQLFNNAYCGNTEMFLEQN